jgi:hypothetical protein
VEGVDDFVNGADRAESSSPDREPSRSGPLGSQTFWFSEPPGVFLRAASQSPALLDFYVWLQSYGLPTTASAVYADSDSDRMNNWQEWVAGTNPTNAGSVLRLEEPNAGPGGVTLTWVSVTNRSYYIERATNVLRQPASRRSRCC